MPRSALYTVRTEYSPSVPYGRGPGIQVVEDAICDIGSLDAQDAVPYPGVMPAGGSAVDGTIHAAALAYGASGKVRIRLMLQVEHCEGPITTAAEADREPRLCFEKLRWLQANRPATVIGNVSAYTATLDEAQIAMCGD